MITPAPLIYGQVPEAITKMAMELASKLLTEHQHCLHVTDMRYSIVPTKHRSYEFLARIWHDSAAQSCTHKATFSLGSDQDAPVRDNPQQIEGTASGVPARGD